MKIAITGHTKGIGKGLYDFYKKKGHIVCGFSRSNGFDIEKKSDEIIKKTKDYDIFFNNAYNGFYQVKLLFNLWEQWYNKEKLIINISSIICQTSYPYKYHKFFSKYKIHKLSLNKAVKELQQTPSKCQVSLISPGSVKTDFTPKISRDKSILNINEIIEVANLIVIKRKKFRIHNITYKGCYI
ncbi:MAG: hypothetical protein OXJ52_03545 [Oligoflexia bacterium]|nr:hypothetical protein [Oligoflexia bacterium]